MMSGNGTNPTFFDKKIEDWTSRTLTTLHSLGPITSHFYLTPSPRHPLKMDAICVSPQMGQVRREFANKNAKFSGERLKFVQIAFLYKLDVIYLKSISNKVSVPSAEKITLLDMYQKGRHKDFWLLVGKIELRIQAVWM